MSRVGKQPITLPDKVSLKISNTRDVLVEGPKGKLSFPLPLGLALDQKDNTVHVNRENEERRTRAMHGTAQRLISNMVHGVSQGYRKDLEIQGVGFRASMKGSALDLSVGHSHPVLHPIPEGIKVTVTENTKISVEGIDKHMVGQVSADIRSYYPPEPYKGKGIRYVGEHVRRKEGKSVK